MRFLGLLFCSLFEARNVVFREWSKGADGPDDHREAVTVFPNDFVFLVNSGSLHLTPIRTTCPLVQNIAKRIEERSEMGTRTSMRESLMIQLSRKIRRLAVAD